MSAASVRPMPEPFTPVEIARYYRYRVPKLRRRGAELRGPCPLHQGERDSFAVNEQTGDWYCHSRCGRGGSIISFEMEVTGRSFAESATEVRAIVGRVERPRKGRIVAEYDYLDEQGRLLFQCVRHEPKGFSQRRPNGPGEWIWNLQGVRRVLFRLPTLKDADTILLAEGEKDVLALVKLGFVATCNPMGAEKWRSEYTEQLAGKNIVIIPDNDAAGESHLAKVAQSLTGRAASFRVARVPDSKDVSDWITAGADREDVQRLVDSAGSFTTSVNTVDPAEETDWQRELLLNDKGAPKALPANAITALRLAPEWSGVLAFNEFSLVTVALKRLPWEHGDGGTEWTDQEDRLTANWLQHQSILVSVEVAGQAVQAVARDRRYHPVRDYLDSLRWDGTKRLDTWLSLYLGVQSSDYSEAVGSRWLISAVARIHRPGAKADCCLILEGEQGTKKSTALKTIAGDWFTDEIAELGSKDAAMQTRGVWIIEIAELDSMSRAEVGKIKGFMSRAVDRFRPPYGKRLIDSPRQCVFAGSVNHSTYLRDETGVRRFWPVICGDDIKIKELGRDRDQLWAEARDRFRAGAPWWLDSRELNDQAAEEQAARCEDDPWHELIQHWVESRTEASDADCLFGLGIASEEC
jgi:predicted P-loop ATPase